LRARYGTPRGFTRRGGGAQVQSDTRAARGEITALAERYPWWGYQRIAAVARRTGLAAATNTLYRVFKAGGLRQKKRGREAALYQRARLWDLLAPAPNELGSADVTYLPIPGHGGW
jgi:transposase InsO family protein